MTRSFPATRKLAAGGATVIFVLLAAVLTGFGLAGSPLTQTLHSVDARLCPFTLDVKVTRKLELRRVGATKVKIFGPTEVTLRNKTTGRSAVLNASGTSSLDPATGNVTFSGRQLWLAPTNHVPYLSTVGKGSRQAPHFVLAGADLHRRVIDPCALLGPPPPTQPVATPAPWELPAFALSQIDYAGLTPLIGTPVRHDHVHLDLIVNGRKVTIPAGVGQAEPVDVGPGPCPPPPESLSIGDCAPGHFFTAKVTASPLQAHTASGIIHIQSDRPGTSFTLGQFFDEWGVRFDSSCVGAYCTGSGKELRVFVDGKRVSGDPRKVVLSDRQEVAVVFGGLGEYGSVPSTYALRWPVGCGGAGERSCFP